MHTGGALMRKPKPVVTSLLAAMLSMGLLLVGAGPAAAATLTVDDDGLDCPGAPYTMIQAAVTDADPGDTIEVCAGDYFEPVTISESLTLQGPNAGDSGAGARVDEANVLSFSITASAVIVDGFSLSNPGIQMNIFSSATILSGIIVKNNIFSGYGIVGFPTNNAGNLVVTGNLFKSPLLATEAMQIKANSPAPSGGCSGTVVSDNVFNAASNNGSADINFSCTGSGSTGVTVSGNMDTGLTAGTSFTAFSGVVDGIVVTNNDVTGTATAGSAIFFFGGVTGSVDINNNVVTGFGGDGIAVRNMPPEGNNAGSFSFTYNDLSANRRSISLGNAFDPGASVTANRNNVSGNSTSVGFQNDSTSLVADATCNWWGSATGPSDPPDNTGTGNAAVGEMDYTPWLTTANLNGPCVGGFPQPATVVGGGQIAVNGGKGTFGFNAKLRDDEVSGHLSYQNHVTKAHLNCTVMTFEELTPTMAKFSGPCDEKSDADSFVAEVQDKGKPKDNPGDTFKITYCNPACTTTDGSDVVRITSGNITIKIGPNPASAESAHGTTAAGAGSMPSGATFNGVSLSGMQLGTGLSIAPNGTAAGEFLAVLIGTSPLGQRQEIGVQGVVVSGSIGPSGTATFGGTATVAMGSGSVPLLNVPFTVTATAQSVLLNLGTSTLPSATLTEGSITIE
jgi:hypothetical protein